MEYIQTSETHTKLDALVNGNKDLDILISDTKEEISNLKEKLKTYSKQKLENNKNIKKHQIIVENRHKHCKECEYVLAKLKD